jgi:Zn-finger domain-containing protein
MSNKFDKIDESLDIEATDIDREIIKKETSLVPDKRNDVDPIKDYEYTRGNLYSLIQKGQEAIDGILEIAQQSDQPRAYEVAGQLIKNVGDVADKLIDLQQKMKKLEEDDPKSPKSITTNNTMFIGSTADLQKMLKNGFK